MSELGKGLLAVVFLLCCLAIAFGLAALRTNLERARKVLIWARRIIFVATGLSVVVLVLFTAAFLTDDFSIAAVAQYSSTKLPFFYKISAVWAGSAGSLLLWSVALFLLFALWQLAIQNSKFKIQNLKEGQVFNAVALSVGSGVCLAFSALLVFVARPFAIASVPLEEGMGLNPLLQNFWMVIHPPLLFVGYSAFLVPFVIALACVFTNRSEESEVYPVRKTTFFSNEVYRMLRRWLLFGICFLSLGIVTGARWSYVELGWGGYWAWDPVENTSLLPWFVAVAALHSIAGMRVADKFRRWTIILGPVPFILCLVATFATRSGILTSLHSFESSLLSVMSYSLLVFIGCCFLLWLVCVIRACLWAIAPSRKSPFHLDKGEILFWAVVTLILTAVIIGGATFWPAISRLIRFSSSGFTPTSVFYNAVISVAGIVWAFLVGLAALSDLPRKRPAFTLKVLVCCAMGLVCFGVFRSGEKQLLMSPPYLWRASLACGICAFSFTSVFLKLLHRLKGTGKIASEVAHLGLLLLVVAAGLSWSERSAQTLLTKGGKMALSGYEFVYDSFRHKLSDGVTQAGPEIIVRKKGLQKKLWPHSSLYPAPTDSGSESQSTSEVAIHAGLVEDIYVSFDGVGREGGVIITAKIKLFMFWLWLAAVLVVAGVALAIFEGKRKNGSGGLRLD